MLGLRNSAKWFAALAVSAACLTAFGDDFNPPPWRGLPGSDFQHWMFTTPAPQPEIFNNPYGVPSITEIDQATWFDTLFGRQGVWCIAPGGHMTWHIPDDNDPAMIKYIRVQFTFFGTPADFGPLGTPTAFGYQPFADGWTGMWADYTAPCAPYDVFAIAGNRSIYLDQLVVDSICVPEPATMAGLGVAVIGLLARRRRK